MGNSTQIKIHKDKLKRLVSHLDSTTQNARVTTAKMIHVLTVTPQEMLCHVSSKVLKKLLSMNMTTNWLLPAERKRQNLKEPNPSDLKKLKLTSITIHQKCSKQSLDAERVSPTASQPHFIQI